MINLISAFLEQAKTDNLKTKHYQNSYKGLKVKVSFGAGNAARIPWIALLKEPNKVQDGIYPVFLYYKEVEKLVLAYGISETKTSKYSWDNDNAESIKDWYIQNFKKSPERYGESKKKGVYDINKIDYGKIQTDIVDVIKAYESLSFDENMIKEDSENYALEKIEKYLIEFSEVADEWFQKQDWLKERYDFYKKFYTKENLKKAEWKDFQNMGNQIHAFNTMAIAKGNALGNMNLSIKEYRRIFLYVISENDPINITINNLYKKYNGTAYLPYFSDSSTSELIAYAYPEKYVIYNRRDVKALEILGLKLDKVRGERFGDKFLRYNKLLQPVLEKYKTIVGKKTEVTYPLELDQFFSWLYETKKADEPIRDLIDRYKNRIKTNGLDDEKYKWEFIRDNKSKPNFDNDILEELKSIKFTNLLYYLSVACLKDIAKDFGPELGTNLRALQEESVDLDDRISKYIKNTLKLYKKTGNDASHHQDERTVAAFLTLYNPTEYTLYKSSYYMLYCDYLGLKTAKANHKYSHYLELIKELAEDYISKDEELIHLVKNELGQLMNEDPNYLLLAQDILYQIIGNKRDIQYWLYAPGENALKWDEFYDEGIFGLGWDELGDLKQYKSREDLRKALISQYGGEGSKKNDVSANDDFMNKMRVGDIIIAKKGRGELLGYGVVKSEYYFDDSRTKFKSCRKIDWKLKGNWKIDFSLVLKTLTDITQYDSEVKEYDKYYDRLMGIMKGEIKAIDKNHKTRNNARNEILYGPPGTGKTFALKQEYFPLYTSEETSITGENKLIERFKFVTFHQSFSYEDFIEGIKPIMPENDEVAEDLGYRIEDGVFKDICKDASLDPDNRYAIFIDEINRGNVSAIFGELITLIETDKRKGSKNELYITLPYSKNTFSVPSNLDIYGTMNTADRSVEALDTALRRRFEFKEMMPDYDIVKDENVEDIQLAEVLKIMNERIELLIDRDHTIGHSYFVKVETLEALANAFNNKIVPLLQEYFYGDYGKIGLVLGKGFVEKIKNNKIDFAIFDYENSEDFKTPTFVLKQVDSSSVAEAVLLLLGKKDVKEIE